MYDQLKYRIPGRPVKEDEGVFQEINEFQGTKGFIFSDFLQEKIIQFHSGGAVSKDRRVNKPLAISKEEYLAQGAQFLNELRENELGKAVFSRVKAVAIDIESKVKLFDALCKAYPNAFVYEMQSQEFGHWIGATPERLIEGKKGDFKTVSLASTKKTEDNTPWSEKEIEEQGLVTSFIKQELEDLRIPFTLEERTELVAGPVKHLQTIFSSIEGADAYQLIRRLHPTPAVSGLPRQDAINLIRKIEKHNRSLYTGFIGEIGDDVNVYVNLRCLQIIGDQAYLYLGGGYTKDSNVKAEWEETENKAKTLIKVMENL
ncbi:MAG: chorismate-binding protein [Crocinitomicaceae bacterium]